MSADFPVPLLQYAAHQKVLETPRECQPANLPHPHPTHSFWLHSEPGVNPLAKEGSEGALATEADVCIIGSGLTGVGIAYWLSQSVKNGDLTAKGDGPLKVVVLDARDFCAGATGRNGGHLTPCSYLDFTARQKTYGTEEALRSAALEMHTARSLVDVLTNNGRAADVDLVQNGHGELIFPQEQLEEEKRDYQAAKEAGMDVSDAKWYTREEVEQQFGSSARAAVIFTGWNIWPMKAVTQLYLFAKEVADSKPDAFSLALHTNTPVTSVDAASPAAGGGRPWTITTPRGTIACTRVVHATNGYASHLLPFMKGSEGIMPVRGQVAAIRATVGQDKVEKNGWSFNEGLEYWFPRPLPLDSKENPLIILGGGREIKPNFEVYVDDDSVINPEITPVLQKFLPSVFSDKFDPERKAEMEWTGIMGYTKMGDPFVGPVIDPSDPGSAEKYKGQYISAGYTGHGMPRTFGCAEVIAGMIAAEVNGARWERPDWLPERYLTWKRYGVARA
ncbi:FAD dependent oxidoreductase [Coniophora puteana RWD-64-598 SS2]|uniref:FAD dependent oxidoreductase n=1 Tax=Coniophora puteana (strain RWD-64-598) TaxID=741705 RepID=A0A5M3MID9_CONPW|nr:FAD dependent oxidoreductase [Coniophora puteana RWD-64-598 SS2]EIW78766.1 FAD dependent oxidoreductase [Coniophora puteana RWD-64-598 SS2]